MDNGKKMGPKVKRLVIEYAATLAIPPGGGLSSALRILSNVVALQQNLRTACAWVDARIAEIKNAPDNELGDDDEVIAGHILELLAQRKAEQAKLRKEHDDGDGR